MRSEVTNGEAAGQPETDPVTNGEGVAAPSSERARYEPWRRLVEVGGWVALVAANTIGNSITVMMDVGRSGLDIDPWEPWVWEVSSAIMWLLIMIALVHFSWPAPLAALRAPRVGAGSGG